MPVGSATLAYSAPVALIGPPAVNALLSYDFIVYVVIGFAAQLVDGALGMAYGVTASSLLLGVGVPPALSSATIAPSSTAGIG